jgi:hypothetical protein
MTGTYTYDSPQDHATLIPRFTRYDSNPIFTSAESSVPVMYWPWAIKMAGLVTSPIDTYYMWYSTDHGAGGIYLATAPDPRGPWTDHGLVFQDPGENNSPAVQAECPSVMFNEVTGLWHCYYKTADPPGRLRLATSPDGVTGWTFHGPIITAPQPQFPGDGFCGYPRPARIGNLWVMHHLMGGENYPHFGISWSHDGLTWQTDPRPLVYQQNLTQNILSPDGSPRRVEWNSGQVLRWQGQLMWIGQLANFTSGSEAVDRVIACAPIADDLRTLLGPPTVLLTADPADYPWESGNMRSLFVIHDDPDGQGDRLWLYYQCNQPAIGASTSNAFGLAIAEVPA